MNNDIIGYIENVRKRSRTSKAALCRAAGISLSGYYNVINGACKPSYDLIIKLLDALGLEILVVDKEFLNR